MRCSRAAPVSTMWAITAAGIKFLWHELQARDLSAGTYCLLHVDGKDHAQVYKPLAGHSTAPWALVSSHGERAYLASNWRNL